MSRIKPHIEKKRANASQKAEADGIRGGDGVRISALTSEMDAIRSANKLYRQKDLSKTRAERLERIRKELSQLRP